MIWLFISLSLAHAKPTSKELSAISNCMDGILSQPYDSDIYSPKTRGQSLYVGTLGNVMNAWTYDVLILPKVVDNKIEFLVLREENGNLRTLTYQVSKAQIQANGGFVSFPELKADCKGLSDSLLPMPGNAACPKHPLSLKVQTVGMKGGTQIVATPTTNAPEIEKGLKSTEGVKPSTDFNRSATLVSVFDDIKTHIDHVEKRYADTSYPPQKIPETVKTCEKSFEGLDVDPLAKEFNSLGHLKESIRTMRVATDVSLRTKGSGNVPAGKSSN